MSSGAIAYRPDLQGLRAIAVLVVLVFHVWPQSFRGGFIGVDVFFVISGYLITGLILGEIDQTGRLDLLRFWARRFLRLLPAATVVLLAVLAGTIYFLPSNLWLGTAQHVLSAALYAENWSLVAQAADYWASAAATSPVQHYWSLSIEEQFYLAWPPVLACAGFLASLGRRSVRFYAVIFLLLIFSVSLALSIVPRLDSGGAYFKTTTRAWELALGALLAVLSNRLVLPGFLRTFLGWLGLIAIIASAFLINEQVRFPGWVALIPTVGTALVIFAGDAAYAPFRLLALRPLQYIGDISYSVYLWHWPLVIFVKPLGENKWGGGWKTSAIIIASTFILAIVTKYLIEDPFRSGKIIGFFRKGSRARFLWSAFITATAMIGATSAVSLALEYRQKKEIVSLLIDDYEAIRKDKNYPGAAAFDAAHPAAVPAGVALKPDPRAAYADMRLRYRDCMNLSKLCKFGNLNGKLTIALVGDSHAMHYAPALEALADRHGWKLIVITKVACPMGEFPFYSWGMYRSDCEWWRGQMQKWLIQENAKYVITSGGLNAVYGGLPALDKQITGYRAVWQRLIDKGMKVIAIRDNPLMRYKKWPWHDVPSCLIHYRENPAECAAERGYALDSIADGVMLAAKDFPGVAVIDLTRFLCTADKCPPVIGNVVVYRDQHHITETFMNTLTPYIERELFQAIQILQGKR